MKFLLVAIFALAAASPDAAARCGPRFSRGVNRPEAVTLAGPSLDAPAFYLRVFANPNRDIVMFFSPEVVVEELKKQYESLSEDGVSVAPAQRAYADEILADLPLKEDTDLYKYVLRGRGNIFRQDFLVSQLLSQGRASIREVNPDFAMKTITMVEQRPDGHGSAATRWFCAPDGLPLFAFYNEFVD